MCAHTKTLAFSHSGTADGMPADGDHGTVPGSSSPRSAVRGPITPNGSTSRDSGNPAIFHTSAPAAGYGRDQGPVKPGPCAAAPTHHCLDRVNPSANTANKLTSS